MISSLLFVVHMPGQYRIPTYTGPAHKQSADFGKMQQFPNYFQTHPDISQIFSRYLIILFSFKIRYQDISGLVLTFGPLGLWYSNMCWNGFFAMNSTKSILKDFSI